MKHLAFSRWLKHERVSKELTSWRKVRRKKANSRKSVQKKTDFKWEKRREI